MKVDPDKLPSYMPERRGYMKWTLSSKENNVLIPYWQVIVFFEIKSSSLKRFKAIGMNSSSNW